MDKQNSEHERKVRRTVSLRKAEQFKKYAVEYIEAKKTVPRGFMLGNWFRSFSDTVILVSVSSWLTSRTETNRLPGMIVSRKSVALRTSRESEISVFSRELTNSIG